MKILVVSDIHYNLQQFDWLASNASRYRLIIIAGDMMELSSAVDPETQAAVLEQYFRRISSICPLVVCSGNHDLIEEFDGDKTPEWLWDLDIPNLIVDCGVFEDDDLRVLSLPWRTSSDDPAKIGAWLEERYEETRDQSRLICWVHHSPPHGTKTSWNGKRDLGDKLVAEWIGRFAPDLVFSGHIHNAPYYQPEGSWIDRVGETVVINGGRQTGGLPATVVVEVEDGAITWCGMEGCFQESIH